MRVFLGCGLSTLLALAPCACKRTPEIEEPARQRGPEPTTAAMTAPPEPAQRRTPCVLSIPKNGSEVTLFPTEEGLREFSEASRGGNDFEMATVMAKHHAILVHTKTPCERLVTGKGNTHVRVSTGPHAGKTGWVASDWSQGD
jgi:hypothetical protein